MILGEVNAKLESVIPLTLLAADGKAFTMSAVVDTGFAGVLILRIEKDSSVRAAKAAHELKLLEAEKIRLLQLLAERECNH